MGNHFGISINVSDGPGGRAVLLIRRWFDFSSMHAKVSLSKILKLKFLLMHRSGYESLMGQRQSRIRVKGSMAVQICEWVNWRSSLSAGIIYQVYYFEFFLVRLKWKYVFMIYSE